MKTILILSGPTHEYFDPVRFIGNASSGLMGKAIAEEAIRQGYDVKFITGPVSDSNLPALNSTAHLYRVTGADEMLAQAKELFGQVDAAIFAAAVADYTPAEKQAEKMPKSSNELMLRLRPTADIAQTLSSSKRDHQVTIGFALQTNDGEINARNKLERKNLDGIVLNTPATLGAPTGTFSFLAKTAPDFEHWGCISKEDCASRIIDHLGNALSAKPV
jgi:phosphopantothenoylcysteine decarboxylase/phosphopantothenate--cysteine ligase